MARGAVDCLGAILVGGGSRRMGRDKALVAWRGRPLVLSAADAVRRVTPHVALVGGSGRGYERLGLPLLPDPPGAAGRGPLAGLLAAMRHARRRVLLVACDAPGWPPHALALLLLAASTALAAAFCRDDRIEPLPGVYDVGLAARVRRCLAAGGRLTDLLLQPGARRLPAEVLGPVHRTCSFFANINDPSDLRDENGSR